MALALSSGGFATGTGTGDLAAQSTGFPVQAVLTAMTNALSADTLANSLVIGVGGGTGTGARSTATVFSGNASAVAASARYGTAAAVCGALASAGAVDGLVDIAAMGATSWTPTIDDAFAANTLVNFLAFGGLTNALAGTFTTQAAAGNQDITGLGFNNPDVVIFWTHNSTTMDSIVSSHRFSVGVGVSVSSMGCVTTHDLHAADPMEADTMISTSRCFVLPTGGPSVTNQWSYGGGITDGFRVVREGGSANTVVGYLALKGLSVNLLSPQTEANTNATAVTGVGFRPKGVVFLGSGNATATETAMSATARMSVGWATDSHVGRSVYAHSRDNVATSDAFSFTSGTRALMRFNDSRAAEGGFDIDSMDVDGFTRDMITADVQTSMYLALALGVAPTKLAIVTQPSATATSGVPFGTQPVVELQDEDSAAVDQSGTTVTAAKASGTGTLGGTLTAVTDANGDATFTDLQITGTGNHTIEFTATGLTAVTSQTIAVSGAPTSGPQIMQRRRSSTP
jgi:hypothetical protein